MTIASLTNRNDYVGNGSVSVYSYTFRIFANTDLLVSKMDTNGVVTTLALTTDYTVSGVGDLGGGSITLVAGNLPASFALTIRRVVSLLQPTDLRNQGDFFPEAHEDEFDRLTMMHQQAQDVLARAIILPETEAGAGFTLTLPAKVARASKTLGFDANGNVTALSTMPGAITVTALMQTLLAQATAALGRGVLGIDGASKVIATGDLADGAVTAVKCATGVTFPSGTVAPFYQATAPTGWTAVAVNDKFLRVVNGGTTGGTTGGTVAASTSLAHTHTVASHTHDLANHTHSVPQGRLGVQGTQTNAALQASEYGVGNASPGSPLLNFVTGGAATVNFLTDTIAAATSGTPSSNTSGAATPATDSQLGAFAYADVVICSKN